MTDPIAGAAGVLRRGLRPAAMARAIDPLFTAFAPLATFATFTTFAVRIHPLAGSVAAGATGSA